MGGFLIQPETTPIERANGQVDVGGGHPRPAQDRISICKVCVLTAKVFKELQEQRCVARLLPSSGWHLLQAVDAHCHTGNVTAIELVAATPEPCLCSSVYVGEALVDVVAFDRVYELTCLLHKLYLHEPTLLS